MWCLAVGDTHHTVQTTLLVHQAGANTPTPAAQELRVAVCTAPTLAGFQRAAGQLRATTQATTPGVDPRCAAER